MSPLVWMIIGLSLILLEFAVPGFIICFFGVGALLVVPVVFFVPDFPLGWQLVVWAVVSGALLLVCRRFLPRIFRGGAAYRPLDAEEKFTAGEESAVVVEGASAGACGKVEFQGSVWNARFEAERSAGEQVTVLRRENLTLIVR